MQLLTLAPDLLTYVVSFADQVPKDDDVKAGWLAFAIFIGLILAVAFLGFSLVKQLRKAQAAKDAGVYDPSDATPPRHQA
ncbi:hypothetical protein [Nocardioides sp. T2.26MG-1]|uniref:hypothetical protein n=1 Tax=Nocardioides sp. T2.26MG-1 TaxID=3041166 RepID=UPI002477BAF5|nr:hypothetical protein [Nocardioides sp. T2.26MG-1]CAI9407560.1 hypothetical protein HIDPHFAB_04807 [Nocardioides sp. T2.26MG-1]